MVLIILNDTINSQKLQYIKNNNSTYENEFRTAVDKYMIFYNEQRTHEKNGYKTPPKKELDYYNKQAILSIN